MYRRESYQEHIQKMLGVYRDRLSQEMAYPAARLEQQMGLATGSLERAVRLAIALHDVGKLDRRWQGWAHEWQKRIGAPVAEDHMLAHTDYNFDDPRHRSVEAEMPGSRPPHAAEGAVAVLKLLHHLLGAPGPNSPHLKLLKAIFTAITRHHSPRVDRYSEFCLDPAAELALAEALAAIGEGCPINAALGATGKSQPLLGLLVEPGSRDELLAYVLIVRALRLADQRALSTGGERANA